VMTINKLLPLAIEFIWEMVKRVRVWPPTRPSYVAVVMFVMCRATILLL